MSWLLALIVRFVFDVRGFPRAIWLGIGVGAVAGMIIALVRGDGFSILYGIGWGFLGGLVFELIIRLIVRIDNKRRAR